MAVDKKIPLIIIILLVVVILAVKLPQKDPNTSATNETPSDTLPPHGGLKHIERNSTPISDILLNPEKYKDTNVVIKGTIEEAVEVNGKAFVNVFDGTGRIILSFPADPEYMSEKGFLFMADPRAIDKTAYVNGTLRLDVPLSEGEDHGSFVYLLEPEKIELTDQ